MVEGVFMFIRQKQVIKNCIWVDFGLTSGVFCIFKDLFWHVCCYAAFVNPQVFIFAVIYDVLCRGDSSAFLKINVG